ncbi:unnamed protein product [Rotaria socialis]|uniref:EGF-like domain-containing protein n=1 Tax=Rotaria socialis TaxID=392032 RepID=A0A818A5V4_9BILA|nr:unnamed protein product [Rotaria socialis]
MLLVFLLLLINNQQIDCQESPSILLVNLLQFHNSKGITSNGQCCDGSFPLSDHCPISISCHLNTIVCLDFINSETQTNWTICPLGTKSIRTKINTTNLFNYYAIEDTDDLLPLQFELPPISDNSINIKIFVFSDNINMLLNHFYTTFRIDMSYSSATDGVFQQSAILDRSKPPSDINQIIVALKTYCRPTFYGKQCSIQCIPNDDCTSSYTCDRVTGQKICSSGWFGSECSIRQKSSTCLSSGLTCFNDGFCRKNQSTCCCPIGFTGSNCQYLATCIPGVNCLNGGSCNPMYDTISRTHYFTCHCSLGYTGLHCQEKQQCPSSYYGSNCTVECSPSNTCSQGHYYCNSKGERTCLNGWGPNNKCTQKMIAPIFDPDCPMSTGCLNGGSCFNGSCCCPPTYTGRLCEISIDPCANNPCQNNALCLSTSTGYKCLCSSSIYTGSLCEKNQSPCLYSRCQNGMCQSLENSNSFSCICYPGFTGQFCHLKIDYCLSQPCENKGICASVATGFVCTCPSNFHGTTCSNAINPCLNESCLDNNHIIDCPQGLTGPPDCVTDIDECLLENEPCKNGGLCINTIGSYHCECYEHYQGSDCSIPIDSCTSSPCIASNSISCTSVISDTNSIDFKCTCRVGFTGSHCEIELNPCMDNPCAHGKCIVLTPLTWSCTCEPGWTGIECKDNINECQYNPCLNGGICIDGMNKYFCECLPSFMGEHCQNENNSCLSFPCMNNGICINNIESYSCLCSIGWTGNSCDMNVDECLFPLSCHPNATCVDLPGSYTCVCPSWLTGENCLTAIDQCETFSCLNNGVCVNNFGSLPTCHCQSGFTGVHCEINIDDCQATPCYNNGTCIDQTNSFLCLCSSGYTGLRCQTIISQCNSLPCLHGGTCRIGNMNDSQDFNCLCPPYFTGKQCEEIINPCLSFPCIHGSCIPKTPSYSCQCNNGYKGKNCETTIDQCSSRPCGSHGNCTNLSTKFSCCCAPGYTGLECEQLVDVCVTNPCSIEGVERCVTTGISSFSCVCKSGYSGRYCEININECLSKPCLNGGICIDFQNTYQCICPLIYTGVNCEYLQDKCVGIQCLNGGQCINNGVNLTCSCSKGYHGENCELIIDYCQSQPCLNGGVCSNTELGAQCTCTNGITGLFCETIIDQCESEPCKNNGTCKSLIDKYVCLCPNGYMGVQCEDDRKECEPVNPCLNSGRCIDGLNNFSCICNPGFTGYYCETQIDQCQSNPCLNGALCRTLINSFKCECPQGYTGSTCSSMINHCTSNPCLNNGFCIPLINDYRCVCLHDYIGLNCEKVSNECSLNPCLNNGTCIDQVWNYTCQCLDSFTGSNCQIQKNHCESSPCIKGLCVNKINGYDCICPSSSYTGAHCEIQISKCASNPCLHGGSCIDGLDNFICICPAWFSGLTCSQRINPCSSKNTCANNGTCIVDVDIKPFGYKCQCLPGFMGQMCEVNVDDCSSQLCRHGQCIDKINGFMCKCYDGYDGIFCDSVINQCGNSPCQNNGICQSLINTYQCLCLSGYQGKNCEKKIIKPCLANPCVNNGTCTLLSDDDFQCNCLLGYSGETCEIKFHACSSNPCRSGTCHDIANGFYYCSCISGYTGFNCETEIDSCDSLPCLHNGVCNNLASNLFSCTCTNGHYGAQCQYIDYQCDSGPCLNNGTCMTSNNGYQCICPVGLTGNRCEIDINECISMPCQNHGICLQSKLNQYQCLCPTGYTGMHCEENIDPCLSILCLNNGTCIRTSLSTGICSCLSGYTGLSCQNQINTCLSAPCLNGTCIPLINSYQCNCFPGYTGQRCDTAVDYCSPNPCSNNGTCINQATSFACQCSYGFQGRKCVIRVQSCQSSPCLNGGTCYDVAPGLHHCSCPSYYRGEFCQLRDSFCLDMPCKNNGICLDTLNGYQCICQPGYNGINCTYEIQPCKSNPCSNNGLCRNTNNGLSYQCSCSKGYAGLQCEFEIDWCLSNPCQNQGTCKSQLTSFICLCSSSYTGRICQTPISNCSLATCKYGVPRILSLTSCSCVCSTGYTGSRCDIPINPCLNDSYCVRGKCNYLGPGLADCTCPIGYSGVRCDTISLSGACSSCPCLYGKCRTIDDINSYICDCYQGYEGKQCDISIDLCKPNPCLYGHCYFDENNGYNCQCLPGSTGRNCSILIDTCGSNPCSHDGVCIQGLNSYQCVCQPGYAGIHCEVLINQCSSLLCSHNGTCVNLPTDPPSARCQCPSLYTGTQCQYLNAPCTSQPCQNLGTCVSDDISSYRCVCPNGFSGINCEVHIQVCDSSPCQNNGRCSEPAPYYYLCQCSWPFYGINCELMFDPCLSYPCRGPLSQCISTPMYQNYTCLCSQGFDGSTCSTPLDPCESSPCRNHGSCIRTGFLTYACSCQVGYEGNNCETEIQPCLNYACQHGIAIRTSLINCECQCIESYYGKFCEMNICEHNPCLVGTCIPDGNTTYTCNCPEGFQFVMGVCADINECRTNVSLCGNGGRCLNTYGSYSCFCKTGFYGKNCEIFDLCRSMPCINGGTCIANENYPYWQCNCPLSYTGSHCETSLLSCSANPCQTGTCINLSHGDYQCLCPTGITGKNCDTSMLPCDSNPCSNNSTCLSFTLTNYTCVCPKFYMGSHCSERKTICSKNLCQGNAICVVNPNSGEEVCLCPSGRYGINCELIAACELNPCVHGTCHNNDENTFQCICQPGFTGTTCDMPSDFCNTNPCTNGGTCSNLGNGSFICACLQDFTGSDCSVAHCTKNSCFNGGTCSIQNKALQCTCPCGYTGTRCETPFDTCALTVCQNNATRLMNTTTCQCSCLCPSTFTGHLCESPIIQINRTYPGQIVISTKRLGGSSWDNVMQCIDQVWNNLNILLVCPSSYDLVTPTSFYPYCYRVNQQNVLKNQLDAIKECEQQEARLAWFQSIDELEKHLMPRLFSRGLTQDFWTSGIYNSSSYHWQWLHTNSKNQIDVNPSIIKQFEINSLDESLYVTFDQSKNRHLRGSSPSEIYSTLCKISATRRLFNSQTRSIDLSSYQTTFMNQTQVFIYNFNYTILPSIPLSTIIQQPTNAQYVTICDALGNPSISVEPYVIDICGHFSSITNKNIELLMQKISSYYTIHRTSIGSIQLYTAQPLNVEHYLTATGTIMTRIYFVITSESSITLGSNIEPLASINDILNTIIYPDYQQCVPYISLNILLQLELCISINEISLWMNLITKAVSTATHQSNVNVMLKGVQEGVTTTGQSANIAYFLITINGITFNQTMNNNTSMNSILLEAIRKGNEKLLCPEKTHILFLEHSVRNLYASCSTPQLLEKQLNNALHQAGIYNMNLNIFGVEEAVDSFGRIYHLPNIFLQDLNGTWLDSPLEFNEELYEIFISNQMQRLPNRVYRLSKAFSYFYSNSLSTDDRYYLEKLILTLYNRQNSVLSDEVKIIYEDLYLNRTSMNVIRRVHLFAFHNEQELDGRYLSSLVLSAEQFHGYQYVQNPLSYKSNQIPVNIIKQYDIHQITFSEKMSQISAERILKDYWQNPAKQGLTKINIDIIQLQEYLTDSINQFYTTIIYRAVAFDDYPIPNTCFNPSLMQKIHSLCTTTHYYMADVPIGYIPSFFDLRGTFSQIDLDEGNFSKLITASLQQMGVNARVSSVLAESRFGLDRSLITRVYYTMVPNQIINQEQIYDQLHRTFSTIPTRRYELYPMEESSIVRSDAHQCITDILSPFTDLTRKNIENYLTSIHSRMLNSILSQLIVSLLEYGQGKILYAESLPTNQTRFYLTFINQTQLINRCDFSLYCPGVSNFQEENRGVKSLYLKRNIFLAQSAALVDTLTLIWMNESIHDSKKISIQLQNQIQYICPEEKRSVRIDYVIKNVSFYNLKSPSESVFEKFYGKFVNDCISNEAYSIYLIEPRLSNKEIHEALQTAWHQWNNKFSVNISTDVFIDSSYLTIKNQTLSRFIYTIKSNIPRVIQPLPSSIDLSNIYTDIPYQRSTIYVENKPLNSTVLSMINKVLRLSWAKANSYLFSSDDISIPSISMHSTLSKRSGSPDSNGQIKLDYMIGLRAGDIGDYSQPSEQLYSQIFNETSLKTSIDLRYKPRNTKEASSNNEQISRFPSDHPPSDSFNLLDWWIILIIVIAIIAIWLLLCLICYICCRKRSTNRYHHKISERPTRQMEVLAREQDHYLRPSLSSLAFDGPYAESFNSSADDQQRISTRTISSQPELQVRRLSEQDWPHFAMHNPYGWSSLLLNSPSYSADSNRPI